ncbi:hypothetical protein L1987_29009 [Smallanthus sonchifolius]|uniref:Uncharacterized protein n=1 Tax=Smallanthus sonchifolius TaxID=185202 RepID=A0ACB9HYQ0_9ASTR|nr:hypothetical protein L1987_29009 [Smallanthus sonchifolius]
MFLPVLAGYRKLNFTFLSGPTMCRAREGMICPQGSFSSGSTMLSCLMISRFGLGRRSPMVRPGIVIVFVDESVKRMERGSWNIWGGIRGVMLNVAAGYPATYPPATSTSTSIDLLKKKMTV